MSFVALIFGTGPRKTLLGAVPLDALLNERLSLKSRATEYPVEDGSPVSDHITQEAEELSITGWVTSAQAQLFAGTAGRSKMIDARETLRAIQAARQPITVTSGLGVYTDMVMEECDLERTNEGDHFSISATLKKIRKVTLRQADIPPDKTSGSASGKAGQTKTNAGKANTQAVDRSDLRKIILGSP
ncbi:phage baseplate protein [Achromobacter aloeverae]